jgi:hypothetical protein
MKKTNKRSSHTQLPAALYLAHYLAVVMLVWPMLAAAAEAHAGSTI